MKSFGVVIMSLGLGLLLNQGMLYLRGEAPPERAAWAEPERPTPTPLESMGGLAALSGGAFLLLLDRERSRGHA